MTDSKWIAERRRELGISQAELARRLADANWNVGEGTIARWEGGLNDVPLDDSQFRGALAEALDMSLSQLMFRSGLDVAAFSLQAIHAAQLIDSLPKDGQELALQQLTLLASRYGSKSQ